MGRITGRRKGGLLRYTPLPNPHNHKVAAVLDFTLRLASHPFLHPLSLSYYLESHPGGLLEASGMTLFFDIDEKGSIFV